jgi:di/tricarboxylate transporter
MGTPATAIIYGSGYLEVRDFARMGTLMAGFSLLVFALTARLWWPLIGFGY